jgi:nitrite reductase (NADH) large subunit
MSEPLIVVGNGMAATRLVEELAKRALGRYAVAVIGDEPRLAYNQVLLSALLAEGHRAAAPRLSAYPGIIWGTLAWVCPTKATDDTHSDR